MLLSDDNYGPMAIGEARRVAMRYIERAIELDPDHAEAWAALDLCHNIRRREQDEAFQALSKVLEINPNLIDARN